jgi:hypothetical protein
MDDQVILYVGDTAFLLGLEEAMSISRTLCGSTRIYKAWVQGHDSSKCHAYADPDPKAATIAPLSGVLQLEIEATMKLLAEKKR